ncbi:hypothetical protein LEMLEM_LOCUS16422 [Lemmus lemmus]
MFLVSATFLHPSLTPFPRYRSFWQGNHLPGDWWDEGKGQQR